MRLSLAKAAAIALVALAAPSALSAAAPPSADVNANGNAFTGGLSFTPASITVPVGSVVRWHNTDNTVPHTATEDHGLWDLGGDYGGTPFNPSGFGPGETVSRTFEAGAHSYYCRVHPTQMHGTVTVPPRVGRLKVTRIKRFYRRVRVRRHGRVRVVKRYYKRKVTVRRYVVVTVADAAPTAGLAFDVQRHRPGGAWSSLQADTRSTSARFRVNRGSTWEVRARLRKTDDAAKATGWAVARITY